MTPFIRRAQSSEAGYLSDLILRSKSYWGYDAATMARLRPLLGITSEQIAHNDVFVIVDDEGVQGIMHQWYRFDGEENWQEAHLEDLFIEPNAIGRSYGTQLFRYALELARAQNCSVMTLEADHNAEAFYLRFGAVRTGLRPSTAGNYSLPQMLLHLMPASE